MKVIKKKTELKTRNMAERNVFLQMNPTRYHEINMAKIFVAKLLPFTFPECPEVRTFAGMLDSEGHFKNDLTRHRMKKIILEMYAATALKLAQALTAASHECSIPVLHLNIDMWTCLLTHDKYIGLRIFFVDNLWEMRCSRLAVRLSRPAASMGSVRLSELLKFWCERVFNEFRFDDKFIGSATSDAGSDVKRVLSTLLAPSWDWCISHLCNCALVDAFGTDIHLRKCHNLEFRALLKRVKSIIEHLHKIHATRIKFEDLQFQETGSRLRLVRDMPNRWLGTIRVIERFLKLWDVLRKHYFQAEQKISCG